MLQIDSKLKQLKLRGMYRSWQSLAETRRLHDLSFTDGMELLLQAEEEERSNSRFERLLRGARFRYRASMEELDYSPDRGLDKGLMTDLATCGFISKGESILVTGKTGTGKSFLASALGHQACLHGFNVGYYNTQKFMLKTKMARLDGSILKFFDKIAKTQLLILDDFGLTHLEKQQQYDLMEVIEDRHGKCSTIISSQLPIACWYDVISESTIADAILDRLVHTSYKIELNGKESLRKTKNR
jgi:DNA replication protein DnaC